jgi:cytoskeletal protein CcmA (bactofilin family)
LDNAGEKWAVIGEDAAFSGRLTGRNVIVNGRVEGELELSGRLRLGPLSVVKATVRAAAVELDGEFEGDIRTASLAFGGTARARGVFQADRLSIREGALVEGALNLPTPAQEHAPAPQATTPAPEAPQEPSAATLESSVLPAEMAPPGPSTEAARSAA